MKLPLNHPDLFTPPWGAEADAAAAPTGAAVAAQPLMRTDGRASANTPLPLFQSQIPLLQPQPSFNPINPPAAPAPPQTTSAPPTPPAAHVNPVAPETLHPALWRAHQVGRAAHPVWASGFAALDPHLPGGGWPAGMLTELLLPHPGVGELRLLAPVLVALQNQQRSVLWVDPPATPCPWALGALGLDMRQQLVVQAQGFKLNSPPRHRAPAADTLWALEQALKSGQVGAVLAWLPQRLPADALRRLQLAAQLHEGPVFLMRSAEERSRASAAPLRLLLSAWGPDLLRVALIKRRGPPLAGPLLLQLPAVLSAPARARALRGAARGSVRGAWVDAAGAEAAPSAP